MSGILDIFLGIMAAMGGFVDLGELVFAADVGAKFGFSLLWVVPLATLGIIVFAEMSGRIAAVGKKPTFEIIRDHLGFRVGLVTLIAANLLTFLTCAAEIGGVALILGLLLGGPYQLMVLLALAILFIILLLIPVNIIEKIFGLLGLALIIYIATVWQLHLPWGQVAAGFIPSIPQAAPDDVFFYLYSIVGLGTSILLPYEVYFYASGAMEDKWKPADLPINKITAIVGFALGSLLCMAIIIMGAQVLLPRGIEPQLPGASALGPILAFGKVGLFLALAGMFFAFGGAAIETCLSTAYNLAQFLKWPWGKEKHLKQVPKFTASWIITLVLATGLALTGIDPIRMVEVSIVFSAVVLPLSYYPILQAGSDSQLMGKHVNGRWAKTLGWGFFILITIVAISAIPLLILTHGGQG